MEPGRGAGIRNRKFECRLGAEALPTEQGRNRAARVVRLQRKVWNLAESREKNAIDRKSLRNSPGGTLRLIVRRRNLRRTGPNAIKATQVNTSLGSKNCVRRFAPKRMPGTQSPTKGLSGVNPGSERGWNGVSRLGPAVSGLVKPQDVGAGVHSTNREPRATGQRRIRNHRMPVVFGARCATEFESGRVSDL